MTNKKFTWYEEGALPPDEYRKQILAKDAPSLRKVTTARTGSKAHPVPKEERRKAPEARIQAEIIAYLKGLGWWVHKAKSVNLVGSKSRENLRFAATQRGVPDLLCCAPRGLFVAVEVKAAKPSCKVSGAQRQQIDSIRKTNGHAFVAHSVKCVERYLEETENLTKPTTRPNY